jgi:DNA modification methylase
MTNTMEPASVRIFTGDALATLKGLPSESVNCCVTSPPYFGLRDYGVDGQIGMEASPDVFVSKIVSVFREARRVLCDDGTLWLNLGDSYDGRKQPLGIPWRVAFALQSDGWRLRKDIIWHKLNPMPESVKNRPAGSHEYVFFLSKSDQYFYDANAVREPALSSRDRGRPNGVPTHEKFGKNSSCGTSADGLRTRRSVWALASERFHGAHFATMPTKLAEVCILAGCPAGGTVLDPFGGAGTTGVAALQNGRKAVLIELNPLYVDIARNRLGLFAEAA